MGVVAAEYKICNNFTAQNHHNVAIRADWHMDCELSDSTRPKHWNTQRFGNHYGRPVAVTRHVPKTTQNLVSKLGMKIKEGLCHSINPASGEVHNKKKRQHRVWRGTTERFLQPPARPT